MQNELQNPHQNKIISPECLTICILFSEKLNICNFTSSTVLTNFSSDNLFKQVNQLRKLIILFDTQLVIIVQQCNLTYTLRILQLSKKCFILFPLSRSTELFRYIKSSFDRNPIFSGNHKLHLQYYNKTLKFFAIFFLCHFVFSLNRCFSPLIENTFQSCMETFR